jgi:tetratricopeptide (TPR) repeat protein
VLEYDNAATHTAEAAKPPTPEDAPAIAKARVEYNAGNQRLFDGDTGGAIAEYRAALQRFGGYVAGYRGLGLAYMEAGNNAEAIKALQTYVRAAPNAKDVPLIKKRIARLQHAQ